MIRCPEKLNPPAKDKIEKLFKHIEQLPMPIRVWEVKMLDEHEKQAILPYIEHKEAFEDAILWIFSTIPPEKYQQPINDDKPWTQVFYKISQMDRKTSLCYMERFTMMVIGMIFLEAGHHGLEAYPVWFFDEENIGKALNIPYKITAIVGFGEATLVDVLEENEVIL